MEFRRETIVLTPETAKEFLDNRYEGQRKLDIKYAETLARDIETGRWNDDLHGADPIMRSLEGKYLNGQHRCMATILANEAILVDVLYDVPKELFEFIDNGKTRTTSQFVEGPHAKEVTSVARFANSVEQNVGLAVALHGYVSSNKAVASRSELLEYINQHDSDLRWCTLEGERIYKAFHGGSKATFSSAIWTILYVEGSSSKSKIIRFVDEITSDQPHSGMIASGKTRGKNKIIDAAKNHVSIDRKYWLMLVLTMYEFRNSSRIKLNENDMEKAFAKYDSLSRRCDETKEKTKKPLALADLGKQIQGGINA